MLEQQQLHLSLLEIRPCCTSHMHLYEQWEFEESVKAPEYFHYAVKRTQ